MLDGFHWEVTDTFRGHMAVLGHFQLLELEADMCVCYLQLVDRGQRCQVVAIRHHRMSLDTTEELRMGEGPRGGLVSPGPKGEEGRGTGKCCVFPMQNPWSGLWLECRKASGWRLDRAS